MSLQWQLSHEIPKDTARIGQLLFAEDNMYRYIGDHFDELLPDPEIFEPLYDTQGRGAIPPLLCTLVTIFQFMEKLPDRYAAEQIISRMDWKYACHLPLTYPGFHFTDLYAFRVRLAEHGQDQVIFEHVLAKLVALGLVKRKGKARTDSSHLMGVVQRLTQLELISECLRATMEAIHLVAPRWEQETLPPAFGEAYEKRFHEFGVSDTQVKERLSKAAKDGYWLLAQIDSTAPANVKALAEIKVLRTVLAQQFPQGPDKPPAKRPLGQHVIESPHETEARFAMKRGKGWTGYKMQVTETCDDDTPNFIVDIDITGALENDSPQLGNIQRRLQERDLVPAEHYVDQGYMSAQNLVESRDLDIELMGVPLADTQGPPGFKQRDFQIDEEKQIAICPAGNQQAVWANGQKGTMIRFPKEACAHCPHFGACTTSAQGRSLTLNPYRAELVAKRAEAETENHRLRMHKRAGVEGAISELVRGYDLRHARYRGKTKIQLQAYFTATAANLNRAIRWLSFSSLYSIPNLSRF